MNRSGYRRSYGSRGKQPDSTSSMTTPTPTEKPPVFAPFAKPEPIRFGRLFAPVATYALPLLVIGSVTGCFDYTGLQNAVRLIVILAALKFHTTLRRALRNQ